MNSGALPVLGWAGEREIGTWDETTYEFKPLNDSIMDEETDKFEHALPTFKPLVVNITKKPLNGKYITYRSIGNPIQRTIICKY